MKTRCFRGDAACTTFVDRRYDQAGSLTGWKKRPFQPVECSTTSLRPMRRDLKAHGTLYFYMLPRWPLRHVNSPAASLRIGRGSI